jgi:hypothetical protein
MIALKELESRKRRRRRRRRSVTCAEMLVANEHT